VGLFLDAVDQPLNTPSLVFTTVTHRSAIAASQAYAGVFRNRPDVRHLFIPPPLLRSITASLVILVDVV
jgi:hypothetical protein